MIPFHKWHGWVDEYLTEQYIHSFYDKVENVPNESKKKAKKNK